MVALLTTKTEYVAVTEASKEMVWLRLLSFTEELYQKNEKCVLYCDSMKIIHLAKNHAYHARTKHKISFGGWNSGS